MKAIILGAGQGRRLLPLTREIPKCLIPVQGDRSMLDVQLLALAQAGVRRVVVMVGFGAEHVERRLAEHPVPGLVVESRFNPLYAVTDNLITTWLASPAMDGDFLLLNGDTLFAPELVGRLLADGKLPVNVAIDHKRSYDDDDMKVALGEGGRLRAIGKLIEPLATDGEAIGMTLFRGTGVQAFRGALETAVRDPRALRAWYPSVLESMARSQAVQAVSIHDSWWSEIDGTADLEAARAALARPAQRGKLRAVVAARPG